MDLKIWYGKRRLTVHEEIECIKLKLKGMINFRRTLEQDIKRGVNLQKTIEVTDREIENLKNQYYTLTGTEFTE